MKSSITIALVSCSIFLIPRFNYAQQVEHSKLAHRYYAGVQTFSGEYEIFYPTTPSLLNLRPWQVIVGVELTSRWTLQLGYSYSSRTSREDPSYTGTTLTGQYVSGIRGSDSWRHAIPLLVRYSLLQRPKPRLQIDMVVGGSIVSSRFSSYGTDYVDGQVVRETHVGDHATQGFITAGLGARYPFGRHVEGVLDWTYSRNLKPASEYVHQLVTGNKWGLTRALSMGLRYRFAVKKKAEATSGS